MRSSRAARKAAAPGVTFSEWCDAVARGAAATLDNIERVSVDASSCSFVRGQRVVILYAATAHVALYVASVTDADRLVLSRDSVQHGEPHSIAINASTVAEMARRLTKALA